MHFAPVSVSVSVLLMKSAGVFSACMHIIAYHALGKGVQPAAAAAQFPVFCRVADSVAPPRRSQKSGRILSSDAEWYIRTVALEARVPCEFPDVLALALLLKTIPQSQATSERTGRQLRDLEGVGRARLLAVRRA